MDCIAQQILPAIQHVPFQHQLLRVIPDTPPRLRELKRVLACGFLVSHLLASPAAPYDLRTLLGIYQCMDDPAFYINERTDYIKLSAIVAFVDLCIESVWAAFKNPTPPRGQALQHQRQPRIAKPRWTSMPSTNTLIS